MHRQLFLVLEYLETDLYALMHSPAFKDTSLPPPLHHRLIKLYLYQMLSGLEYCHQHRIIHRCDCPEYDVCLQ